MSVNLFVPVFALGDCSLSKAPWSRSQPKLRSPFTTVCMYDMHALYLYAVGGLLRPSVVKRQPQDKLLVVEHFLGTFSLTPA